jgi:chitinase
MILSAVLAWTLVVPQRTATELPRQGSAVRALNVGGYLPAWRFPQLTAARAEGLTDLIVFSVQPTHRGEIDLLDLSSSALTNLRRIKSSSRFRTWLTVGGWSRSAGFAATAANPDFRKRLIEEASFMMEREGFIGIDFDWESPKTPKELADYATLIEEAKAHFAPKKMLVSASMRSWVNIPKIVWKSLDRIHLLSYDHDGRHSTLEDAQKDVEAIIRAGAPAWKIQLGVPFYGRSMTDWKVAMGYSEISRLFAPKPYADEAGGYWFNGPETLRAKVDLAREMNLGGIVVWEIGQDAVGEGSLLKQLVSLARPTVGAQPRPEPKPITPKANKAEKGNSSSKSSKSVQGPPKSGSKPGSKTKPKTSSKKP